MSEATPERPRILFVTRAPPNANGRGVDRRASVHLEALKRLGPVTIVMPASAAAEGTADGLDFDSLGADDIIIRPDETRCSASQRAYEAAANPLARIWRGLRRRHHIDQTALPRDVAHFRLRLENRFDLVLAYRMSSAVWIGSILGEPAPGAGPLRVVDFDDVESSTLRRAALGQKQSPFWRLLNLRYTGWLRTIENHLLRRWSAVIVCQEPDAQRLAARTGRTPWVVANAAPFPNAPPEVVGRPLRVLFVGTLSYAPNAEGLIWFVDKVWPLVRARLGDGVVLEIAGIAAPAAILAMNGRAGVTVLGRVEDLAPVYARANLVIAPIFTGGGTRIKLIEAFAYRRAVVTTRIGCEGLEVEAGLHVGLAADPAGFAAEMLRLLADPAARRAMADAAHSYSEGRFSTRVVVPQIESRLRELLARA